MKTSNLIEVQRKESQKNFLKWKQRDRYCYLSSANHRFPGGSHQWEFYPSSHRHDLTLEFLWVNLRAESEELSKMLFCSQLILELSNG